MKNNFNIGDIILIDLNPTKGHEQGNKRPCLIVSNDLIYQTTNNVIIVPISKTEREYPFYIPIEKLEGTYTTYGKIMLDQIRVIDPNSRNAIFCEKIAENDLLLLLEYIQSIFVLW